MSFVLAITGPTGAGKSTVAEKLAKQLDHCVNIDVDHIKHMIVSGFYKDANNAGGWGFSQWGLAGQSIGLLAKNFLDAGYDVIINGHMDEIAWVNVQKLVTLDYKVLLLPHVDAVMLRDAGRREDVRLGGEVVKEHHDYFSNDDFFNDFTKIDTTTHTADDTVSDLKKLIAQN